MPASAKAVEDNEREKKSSTLSGLPFRDIPLFDTKTVEGVVNPTFPFHISYLIHNRRNHWKRGPRAHIPAKVAWRQIPRIESEWYVCWILGCVEVLANYTADEWIELDDMLDPENDIGTKEGGSSPVVNTDKGLGDRYFFPLLRRIFWQTTGQINTREDLDDSDDDFPPLNRLLERFRKSSPEDRSDTKSSAEEGDNQVQNKEISGLKNQEPEAAEVGSYAEVR
jgi:hypothetical protein